MVRALLSVTSKWVFSKIAWGGRDLYLRGGGGICSGGGDEYLCRAHVM